MKGIKRLSEVLTSIVPRSIPIALDMMMRDKVRVIAVLTRH